MTQNLALVKRCGGDHGRRRQQYLLDAELLQFFDRRAIDDTADPRPDQRAHAHRARLARGVEDDLLPRSITVPRDIVVDRDYLAVEARVGTSVVDSGRHD